MENNIIAKVYLVGGSVVNICDKRDYEIIKERFDERMRGTLYRSSRFYLPNTELYLNDEYIACLEKVKM